MKKKALIIGSYSSESLSPFIFNYWFKKHNIQATYCFKEIKINNFRKEIQVILNDEEIVGFNITIPFKEKIKNSVSSLSGHSKKIGAVNCVSRINKKWVGKNTDWIGFYKSIEHIVNEKKLNTAFVFGYGGASKAILYALKKIGIKKINIYNRTAHKIKHLSKDQKFSIVNQKDIYKQIKNSDIIINTTPTNILKTILDEKKQINKYACDIVYKPKDTNFLLHFKKEKRIYGILMLIYQAAPCFEDWFGIKPTIDKKLFSLLEDQMDQ